MTRLRKMMLDELQRRNYTQTRSVLYQCGGGFREVLPPFARSPRPRTYSRVPGSPVSRLQALGRTIEAAPRSAFSLRQDTADDPICPITFRFPSVRGACPRY